MKRSFLPLFQRNQSQAKEDEAREKVEEAVRKHKEEKEKKKKEEDDAPR